MIDEPPPAFHDRRSQRVVLRDHRRGRDLGEGRDRRVASVAARAAPRPKVDGVSGIVGGVGG
jgi:hypothetical protein